LSTATAKSRALPAAPRWALLRLLRRRSNRALLLVLLGWTTERFAAALLGLRGAARSGAGEGSFPSAAAFRAAASGVGVRAIATGVLENAVSSSASSMDAVRA